MPFILSKITRHFICLYLRKFLLLPPSYSNLLLQLMAQFFLGELGQKPNIHTALPWTESSFYKYTYLGHIDFGISYINKAALRFVYKQYFWLLNMLCVDDF